MQQIFDISYMHHSSLLLLGSINMQNQRLT